MIYLESGYTGTELGSTLADNVEECAEALEEIARSLGKGDKEELLRYLKGYKNSDDLVLLGKLLVSLGNDS